MTTPGSVHREIPSTDPGSKRRSRRRIAAVLGVIVALGWGLSGCADSAALGLVHQACHKVKISLALYRAAEKATDPAVAAQDMQRAETQLQLASPLASEAAGEAPQWQALMATLGETSRLPESELVPALQAQCSIAQTGNPNPILPDTTLPAPPGGTRPGTTTVPTTSAVPG